MDFPFFTKHSKHMYSLIFKSAQISVNPYLMTCELTGKVTLPEHYQLTIVIISRKILEGTSGKKHFKSSEKGICLFVCKYFILKNAFLGTPVPFSGD